MKSKHLAVFLFALLIFSSLAFVSSQGNLEDLEKNAEKLEENTQKLEEGIEKAQDLEKYGKWDYLSGELEEIFMKNRYIDYFFSEQGGLFSKGNIVFVILFGEDYNFSLGFLVLIVLWFYFFIQFSGIMRDFSTFSGETSIIIGLCLTLILAQLGIFSLLVQGLGLLVASPDAWWIRSLITIGIILFFVLFVRVRIALGKIEQQMKKQEAEQREKMNRHYLDMTVEAIKRGFGFR